VPTLQIFATNAVGLRCPSVRLVGSRSGADGLAHLPGMDTKTRNEDVTGRPQLTLIEQVLSLSELAASRSCNPTCASPPSGEPTRPAACSGTSPN
jgi:hypothetical protein